jgi:hypothetical protein
MSVRTRGQSFQVDGLLDGKRVRKSFKSLAEAEAYDRTMTQEMPIKASPLLKIGQLFHGCYELNWRHSLNCKDCYRLTRELVAMLGADNHPNTVTTSKVRELIQLWRNKGNSEKTINRKLAALSKCMKYAKGELPSLELPEIKPFKERAGRIRFLTSEEEHKLFNGLSPKHRAFSKFLLYTGCRVGEAVALEWQDVTGTHVTFWRTKGDRPRTVPLSERAKEALREGREAKGAKPWVIRYDAYNTDWHAPRLAQGLRMTLKLCHTSCGTHVPAPRPSQRKPEENSGVARARQHHSDGQIRAPC